MLTIKNIQLFFSQSKQFVSNFKKKEFFLGAAIIVTYHGWPIVPTQKAFVLEH